MPVNYTGPFSLPVVPPFEWVDVDNLIPGGARVQWQLRAGFCETGPYTFTLQVADNDVPGATWTTVAGPATDVYFLTDAQVRLAGKELNLFYRVQMLTSLGTVYVSDPIPVTGKLSWHEWGWAREIIRKERLDMHRTGVEGIFYKMRHAGPACSACYDPDLGEATDSKCPVCYGTRIQGGYYAGLPGVFAKLPVRGRYVHRDMQRGMINQVVLKQVRMLAVPYMSTYDVWVNKFSDEHYFVHEVNDVSEMRGAPLVVNVELRLAPFDDVIYSLPRPA